MNLQKAKVILVTGATRGLGLAITERLLKENFYVIGLARKTSKSFEDLQKRNPNLKFEIYDLKNVDGLHDLVKKITSQHGSLYGLVNNAAIGNDGVLATMHDSQIHETVTLNLVSTVILTKYVVRNMLLNRSGRIVNISSIIATTGFSGLSVYGATKSALVGFTKSLARELGPAGISVNLVAPGYLETDMTGGIASNELEKIKRRSPLGHLARVQDVAAMVCFLFSEDGGSMTGASYTVDAGSTA